MVNQYIIAMTQDEKYAKLLALSIIYEKEEEYRIPYIENISCNPEDSIELLKEIHDPEFKSWVKSIMHLFKPRVS